MFPSQLHINGLLEGVFISILIGACIFEESLLSANVSAAKSREQRVELLSSWSSACSEFYLFSDLNVANT